LPELERHVLGRDRGADVMSELIPRTYLDFVCGGPPEPLVPVFRHNRMDLQGLAGLSGRVLSLRRRMARMRSSSTEFHACASGVVR
jgi:uncharacterized protein YprB with RNaseH-like and TPR domain